MIPRKIDAMHEVYGISTGNRCANCPHLVRTFRDRAYYKCEAYGLSCSEATDWRMMWDACGLFDKPLPTERKVIERIKYIREKNDEQIEGQITLDDLIRR